MMTLKLGMQHLGLGHYQICSNDDPWLAMTYFTARSNSGSWAFVWGKRQTVDFSEAIEAYDIHIFNHLNAFFYNY